jgi:hypothetical protein
MQIVWESGMTGVNGSIVVSFAWKEIDGFERLAARQQSAPFRMDSLRPRACAEQDQTQ